MVLNWHWCLPPIGSLNQYLIKSWLVTMVKCKALYGLLNRTGIFQFDYWLFNFNRCMHVYTWLKNPGLLKQWTNNTTTQWFCGKWKNVHLFSADHAHTQHTSIYSLNSGLSFKLWVTRYLAWKKTFYHVSIKNYINKRPSPPIKSWAKAYSVKQVLQVIVS